MGDYSYDIQVFGVSHPANADSQFCASVVNMVRRESGDTVSVNARLPDAYGATRDDAVSKLQAAVEAWVTGQWKSK